MFTGIVTALGTIREARQLGDLRLTIAATKEQLEAAPVFDRTALN